MILFFWPWLDSLLSLIQQLDLLGLVGLIHYSAERSHFHSFILLFSRILAWACSYGGRSVSRTIRKRKILTCKLFLKSLHFSCLPFVSGAKAYHMAKSRVTVGR